MKPYYIIFILFFGLITVSDGQANEIEKKFIKSGLIDIHEVDKTIKVDLVNSDPNKNYFRENHYNGLNKAYLRREVAEKLSAAQKYLKSQYPEYSIYWGYSKLKIFNLSETQKKNRELLSTTMKMAGFFPLSYEWWHFNGMPKDEARQRYRIID